MSFSAAYVIFCGITTAFILFVIFVSDFVILMCVFVLSSYNTLVIRFSTLMTANTGTSLPVAIISLEVNLRLGNDRMKESILSPNKSSVLFYCWSNAKQLTTKPASAKSFVINSGLTSSGVSAVR